MTTERTFQGAWRISNVVNGALYSRQYFDYTKREAIATFKSDVAEEQAKIITEQRA